MAKDAPSEWIRCPGCEKKIAKKIAKGRYETSMKHNKTTRFTAELVMGTVVCPRCENRVDFPLSSIKEPNS